MTTRRARDLPTTNGGPVVRRDPDARRDHLRARYPAIRGAEFDLATANEDAFDAAVSALVMDEAQRELAALPARTDAVSQMEGRIWWPGGGVAQR